MTESTIWFQDRTKFKNFLVKNLKRGRKEAEKVAKDLDPYHRKASQLGFKPSYTLTYADKNFLSYNIGFDREPTKQELIEICLASKKPRKSDLNLVERLRRELQDQSRSINDLPQPLYPSPLTTRTGHNDHSGEEDRTGPQWRMFRDMDDAYDDDR